jgi:bifunctional DNA-binding transcriptional regulator/antitoxin component of YhaV-PrlF toxin-antitoxin module
MTGPRTFEAVVEADDRGRVSITIPFDPSALWGVRPRHHVSGTLNGHPFEGSLGVRGGRVFFPLAKKVRADAGIKPGDVIEVTLAPVAERSESVPPELAEALAADPAARTFFDGLSGFYRRQYAESLADGDPATRRRRAAQVIDLLRQGRTSR